MLRIQSTIALIALIATTADASERSQNARSLVETAESAGVFKTLLAAAEAADLVDALQSEGPLTVLAPTDEAFAKIPQDQLQALLQPENKPKLRAILLYHVIPGNVSAADAISARRAETAQETTVRFAIRDGRLSVNDANVLKNDIAASNGTIHVIDSVLIPDNLDEVQPAGRKLIGIAWEVPTERQRRALGLDSNSGILITRVFDDYGAKLAGLQAGDIITRIDGEPASIELLRNALAKRSVGASVPIAFVRAAEVEIRLER